MAATLEQSRKRYARLRAPFWVPAPPITSDPHTHAMIEYAAAVLEAYTSFETLRHPGVGHWAPHSSSLQPVTVSHSISPACVQWPFAPSCRTASDERSLESWRVCRGG